MKTKLLCFSGGYARPTSAILTLPEIEAQIAALEPGQNLVVTGDGYTYPSSMTPLYSNGEQVLADCHRDGSISRSFDPFDLYTVAVKGEVEHCCGNVWRMEIEPLPGARLNRRETVFCGEPFHSLL